MNTICFSICMCVYKPLSQIFTHIYIYVIIPCCVQAAFILVSVTYNLHQQVYGVRGGRGLIRDTCIHPWSFKALSRFASKHAQNLIIDLYVYFFTLQLMYLQIQGHIKILDPTLFPSKEWAKIQSTRLRALGTHLVSITRSTPNSRQVVFLRWIVDVDFVEE